MWTAIIGFIGGPVIRGLLDAYNAKLKAGNTSEKIAADAAAGEMAVQTAEIKAQTEYRIAALGYWYEPTNLFGYIMVIYFGKIVLVDKVLASLLGTEWATDPLRGDSSYWAGMIMLFFVGKRGFENVASILKRK